MKWLCRGFWLLAWYFWLWLGIGLYRELPRDLGPAVCKLKVTGTQYPLGFLPDNKRFATHTWPSLNQPKSVFVWDATNGDLLETLPTPPRTSKATNHPTWLRIIKSCLVGYGSTDATENAVDWVFNLDARQVSDGRPGDRVEFHPTRPLAVFFSRDSNRYNRRFVDQAPSAPSQETIRLIDLPIGDSIFRWPRPLVAAVGVKLAGKPIFFGSNRLAIPAKQNDKHRLEIWDLDALDFPPQVIEGLNIESDSVGASEHRIAWQTGSGPNLKVHVYDLNLGREIFEAPSRFKEKETEVRTSGWDPMMRFDSTGRGLLNPNFSVLWDVETGRTLWRGGYGWMGMKKPHPEGVGVYASAEIDCDPPDRFESLETWYYKCGSWSGEKTVYALRSLRDGSVLYRCWKMTATARVISPDGLLMVDSKSWNVHELPPPVNWPLLAVCQAVLAAPLVLMWAFLRWRRRRKVRSQRGLEA